jgi:aromatic ring-opening dioxygenase catalytic subunit (LigB family)
MGEIVFAAGIPHLPAMVGLYDRAPPDVQAVVHNSFESLHAEIKAARPDVIIVFANDHLANSRIRSYPDFLIGMAEEHRGPHEWFKPWIGCRDYAIKGDRNVAATLFRGMIRRGIRLFAEPGALKFDDIPLVPVLQNCIVPPIPEQHRCYEVGQALADLIEKDLAPGMRVALIGSGGLSHEPGGSRYYVIDETFDRWFLDLAASGDHDRVLKELTFERMEASGSGGTIELFSWVVIMGATGPCKGRSFGYAIHRDFRCGFGAVIWDLKPQTAQAREQVPA